MQVLDQTPPAEIKGKPIGGWLWVVMLVMIASGFQILIGIITTTRELFADDWNQYANPADEFLRTRINIYAYIIFSMTFGLVFVAWSLVNFLQRKKRFAAVFMGLLAYFIVIEVLRIYLLNYYASLVGQEAHNIESGLAKTGIFITIAGLYLNKGKRPIQTFVN